MKKFLKYSLLFLIPVIVFLVSTEYLLRQFPIPYKYKYEWMQKNADNVETLVFGSSHCFYGICPKFFESKAFSLANVSQGWAQDLFLLEYWADRYKNLNSIIVPISSYSWFSPGLEFGGESYRCRYYRIYMDCNLYPFFSLYNLEISDYTAAKNKMKSLIYSTFIKKAGWGCDEYGWSAAYPLSGKNMINWNNGTEADAAVKRHTAKSWDYIEQNYAKIKEMAEFCKKRNINMVLVTTPCWHSYYDNLPQEQLSKMYELTHKIQKEYNLPYFDYLKDKRFEADDFYDSNHLSDVGAIKFTKILNEDIHHLGAKSDNHKGMHLNGNH